MPGRSDARASGLFLAAAGLAALSALLRGAAMLLPSGPAALPMLLAALAWAALAAGLAQRLRAVAWIAFFAALAGCTLALSMTFGSTGAPRFALGAIAATEALLAATLFRLLWRAP